MADSATMNEEVTTDIATNDQQYLTFKLKDEDYGIDILRVQEIRGFSKVRPIPNAPSYIKGVINLRGAVVPIVDLRHRFQMDETDYNQFTVIIVVSIGKKVVGLVVDAVSDVLSIATNDIEQPPEMGGDMDTSYFSGMAKVGEKLVLVLDIDKLVSNDQLRQVEDAA